MKGKTPWRNHGAMIQSITVKYSAPIGASLQHYTVEAGFTVSLVWRFA
jgi:hypothetical protein